MYLDVVVGIGMKENRLLYRISQFAFNSDAETVPHIHTQNTQLTLAVLASRSKIGAQQK